MKPAPCFSVPPELVAKADAAHDRLTSAMDRLKDLLGPCGDEDDAFGHAMGDLIDADKKALQSIGGKR